PALRVVGRTRAARCPRPLTKMHRPLPHVSSAAVSRRYFGTDGVRGIVGEDLTTELVEHLGRAATVWSGRGRIFVGRDAVASGLAGLKTGVDCANGAYSGLAPRAFEQLGAEVTAIGDDPDGTNINVGCGATDLRLLQRTVMDRDLDLGVGFDGDGDRMLAVDGRGEIVDGDQIVAVLALERDVELVAVTVMANMGLHRLMSEHGIRVVTTDVGD